MADQSRSKPIIPHSAFSAATMLATSADELVLDDTSALGPIDPQIQFRDPQTGQSSIVPTQAILEGFETAKTDIKADPDVLGVYLPLLNKLDLALFEVCKNANQLAESLVIEWLKHYLLKDENDPAGRAVESTGTSKFSGAKFRRVKRQRPESPSGKNPSLFSVPGESRRRRKSYAVRAVTSMHHASAHEPFHEQAQRPD